MSFITMDDTTYIDALIGIYEINNVALLRDVFIEAYRASANNYKAPRARLASVQRRQGHALGNLPVPKTAHKFF